MAKIEEQISTLSETELRTFRSWFMKFDAAHWDEQFAREATAGKLNELAAEALEQYDLLPEGKMRCRNA